MFKGNNFHRNASPATLKFFVLKLIPSIIFVALFFNSAQVHSIARQSTLTMSVQPSTLSISLIPSISGNFAESSSASISVTTDNYTGYSVSITTGNQTSLVDNDNNEIESISSAISNQDFTSNTAYNNKWGLKPSQYISSSGGVDTVVNNSNFLPAPTGDGLLVDKTSAANSVANTYSFSFGTRVNTSLPAGNYSTTYTVIAIANPIQFNITYDDNTTDTVTGMPSPNPQSTTIDGGTPAADSHATLSSAVPVRSGKEFAGWCDVAPTTDQAGDDSCSGTLYSAGDTLPIDQTAGPNITLYATWVNTLFPIVWDQMGKCIFNNGVISGSECQDYVNDDFIDTGIALYSSTNYQKDYEVHFTLDVFNPGGQTESQATIFNDKLSSSVTASPYSGKSPGMVVRITSSKTFEIKSTYGAPTEHAESRVVTKTPYATAYNGTDVRIFRISGTIYTSIDNGPLIELQDYTSFNQQFGLTAWFGAYPDNVNCTENCTAAKRYFTGEMSNMYIKMGTLTTDHLHEITFDGNGGTPATTTHLILDGDSLAELPEVTRSGWLFDGWWTASSGGQQISTSTVPDSTTIYYAHWYKSVTDAQITNTSISMAVSDTETINITNASDLEPYTFTSSDPTVATVSSAGVVTGVSNGTATITMTGSKTGDTRTISVAVGNVFTIDFDSDGGSPATYQETVAENGSFSSLPGPTRTGYELEGWYTGRGGTGTKLTTSTVFTSSTPTQYYANWTQATYVCKVATVRHSEQCLKSSGGCYGAGWATNAQIDYGYLITDNSTVTAGAAYDCDVNNDGTHDSADERFYYFGTENGNAKLIYYKNMSNNASVAYADAIALLPNFELDANNPSTPVWSNPNLVRHTTGAYAGKAARFMTYPEITNGLYSGGNNHITPSDSESTYLFEQSNFAANDRTDGIWLEEQTNYKNRIQTNSRQLTHGSTSANASRPTIDVPTQYIEPYTAPASTYTITFNPHNETSSWTETIDAGDDLTNAYPSTDPTYTDHLFQGWFTAASSGTQISSSTVPSGDTEYHAQWLKTVALATVDSNSMMIKENDTETLSVTNSAELEPYTFSSLDTSIATVDSSTGAVTGVASGTTTIRITGTTSGAHKDIPVTIVTTVCELATSNTLHTSPGSSGHYGQIAENTTPQAGDAYNCDVDNDGTYSATNERFYYLGQDGDNNAVLVAWNSYYNSDWAPGTSSDNNYTYANALLQLPSNAAGAWDHPGLIEQDTGKAARFTNYTEVVSACGNINVTTAGALDDCDYLMEHSAYDSGGRSALWLNYDGSTYRRIHAGSGNHLVGTVANPNNSNNMVRPAIVVPYKLIDKYVAPAVDYSITFDPQNGDSAFTRTVTSENSIGTNMPQDPTYANHAFIRWYDTSNNNTVTSATVPTANMTVYAEWKLDVTQATISNNDLTLAVGDNITIQVSNAAQLESYTFSSSNTSIATVDTSTGVITGTGVGTTNIIMTGSSSHLTKSLEVDVTAAPAVMRNVTFNANGGTTPTPYSSTTIEDGEAIGSLPTTTRTNYRFFGWYTDDGTFYDEVTPATEVDSDIIYYARWIEDTTSFPIVFAEINECEFNGNAVISGTYCTQDKTKKYVDSGVALFSTANYQKDFEIGFTVTELPTTQLVNQATLVNSKRENSDTNYPGFVFRSVSTGPNFELTGRFSHGNPTNFTTAGSNIHRVKIVREDEVLKYSIDDGALTTWYNVSGNTHRFDTNVWFGAAVTSNDTGNQRQLTGKLTDMYVKLGAQTEYTVNFDPDGGSLAAGEESRTITIGDEIGQLPVPTPPSANYTFDAWYDESVSPAVAITASTRPDSNNKTYVAHYNYQSSNTPVVFDVSNDATRGYQDLVDEWTQSPVNLTTFNKATPINNSTWGDTSELSELEFWQDIRSNFVDNGCLIPSYSDAVKPLNNSNLSAWTSGTVDCSKPDAYDTKMNAAVTVRLNNAQGAVVSYAKASDGIIHNMIPGQTYYWEKTSDSTMYGYVTATSNKGTRWVDTGTIRNVRDLGGLPVTYTDSNNQTVTGTVAYGRLFRGEKLNSAPATELTNLGITTEYNVGDEYADDTHLTDYHLNQVVHYDFDYNSGDENNSSSNYMKAWTAVTNIMTDIVNSNDPKNVFFHCRVGADRTGTVAYLLEGLLGVPDEMRYEEYALTNVSGLYDRTRYYKQKSSSNANKFVYMMGYVKTNQDIYDWYMQNSNASAALIQSFRSAMTVTSNQQQQSPQNSPQNLSAQNLNLMSLNNNGTQQTSSTQQNSGDSGQESDNTNNTESNGDGTDSSSDPLGVTETSGSTTTSDSPANIALAFASTAAAIAGATSFALAKNNKGDEA